MTPFEIIEDLDENEDFRQPLADIFKDKMDTLVSFLEDRINREEEEEQIARVEKEEEFSEKEVIPFVEEEPSIFTRIGRFFKGLFR